MVAVIVGALGVVMLLAGVNGSGAQLFASLFGKGSVQGTPHAGTFAAAAAAQVGQGTATTVAGGGTR